MEEFLKLVEQLSQTSPRVFVENDAPALPRLPRGMGRGLHGSDRVQIPRVDGTEPATSPEEILHEPIRVHFWVEESTENFLESANFQISESGDYNITTRNGDMRITFTICAFNCAVLKEPKCLTCKNRNPDPRSRMHLRCAVNPIGNVEDCTDYEA